MLDLNHLKLFVEIVKVGSFVGAARRLITVLPESLTAVLEAAASVQRSGAVLEDK